MVPTKDRNHSGIFITYNTHGFLFDCGENIQRQFKIAGIKPTKIDKIFISHWHGDHVFGLPGLLNTLSASGYEGELEIYGPKGTKEHFSFLGKAFESKITIPIRVVEQSNGILYEDDEIYVEAFPLNHHVPTMGFRVVEKDRLRIHVAKAKKLGIEEGPIMGKLQKGSDVVVDGKKIKFEEVTYCVPGVKVGYIADTRLCENMLKIAKDADILISESTFTTELEQKAEEYFHLTSLQAAMIASKANAKKLILTHFSQRYNDVTLLVDEAKQAFKETVAAHDFMKIKL